MPGLGSIVQPKQPKRTASSAPPTAPVAAATNGFANYDPRSLYPAHAAAPAAAPASAGPTVNTAAPDPNANWLIDKYKSRFDKSNVDRAIAKSNAGIADAAALLQKDAQGSLASRGARGSGVGAAFIQKNITNPAQRQAADAASDIAQGELTRQDQLTMGGLGIMRAPADIAMGQQSLANQQYSTSVQLQIAQQEQAARAAQMQWAQTQALMASI